MSSVPVDDRDTVMAVLDRLDADQAVLAELSMDTLTHPELLAVLGRLESLTWRTPAITHRLLARLSAEASPIALGAPSLAAALSERLRISRFEAHRRLKDAAHLGPRRALSGEPLPPKLTHTAAAQARGAIGPEHVKIIGKFFDDLPDAVDFPAREHAEATLARIAAEHLPDGLTQATKLLLALLHPDGDYTDTDRARKRFLRIGPQGPDGLSPVTGLLTPETAATWDAVMAGAAAPGKCNPEDDTPCVDGDPAPAQVTSDQRSQGQRTHDAFLAVGRAMLASGQLGSHHGLPATIVVLTTLQDLDNAGGHTVTGGAKPRDPDNAASHSVTGDATPQGPDKTAEHTGDATPHDPDNAGGHTVTGDAIPHDLAKAAGYAITAGGIRLPMRDVIRIASHAHHYLAVFDKHTREALYLGRTKRLASPGQRIMLYARDRGCTKPGCTVPANRTQVHHATRDWDDGGNTNINELTLACKPDNLLVENTDWTTRIRKDGRTEWLPPPHLDTGQTRINDHHHPEHMLRDPGPDEGDP
jgi:hypothetical protein